MVRFATIALVASLVSSPATAGDEADTVSILCKDRKGTVKLSVFVDTKKRSVSVRNERTGRWDIIDNVFLRLYHDEIQIPDPPQAKHFIFVDRTTGAFRYSRKTFDAARNSKPVGTCEKTAFAAPPEVVTVSGRPNKF